MDEQEMQELLIELGIKTESDAPSKVKPVQTGGGLISYRKYLWALKFMEEKATKLKEYRTQVVKDIDRGIEKQEENIGNIRGEIRKAMLVDPTVSGTKTGGKNLALPDIATVSLSKEQTKVDIYNPETVLERLGEDFKKVVVSLDRVKAKQHILKTGKAPDGAEMNQSRTLSIRFKK